MSEGKLGDVVKVEEPKEGEIPNIKFMASDQPKVDSKLQPAGSGNNWHKPLFACFSEACMVLF